ncbi:hypothetical protein P4261_28205 [Bacillus thuringiensis]|nr:hypothetical protein [Bacillus thuringiensis]MED2829766.1 hypothetical protein [Bacillus thuringiensis]MED2856374.1 hypothetical protein [Bacillus thuringiensis]MED2863822.1 hypothetical protein [Bacillus thuringiensis]
MIKARIKLKTGELVTKTFEDRDALIRFINEGHELIKAIDTK